MGLSDNIVAGALLAPLPWEGMGGVARAQHGCLARQLVRSLRLPWRGQILGEPSTEASGTSDFEVQWCRAA